MNLFHDQHVHYRYMLLADVMSGRQERGSLLFSSGRSSVLPPKDAASQILDSLQRVNGCRCAVQATNLEESSCS